MYSKKELEILIKNKINNNQISEAINVLENEIKQEFVARLKTINPQTQYIDHVWLKNDVEKYLSKREKLIFKKFFVLLNIDTHELYQLEKLKDIYNILKKEGEQNEF